MLCFSLLPHKNRMQLGKILSILRIFKFLDMENSIFTYNSLWHFDSEQNLTFLSFQTFFVNFMFLICYFHSRKFLDPFLRLKSTVVTKVLDIGSLIVHQTKNLTLTTFERQPAKRKVSIHQLPKALYRILSMTQSPCEDASS